MPDHTPLPTPPPEPSPTVRLTSEASRLLDRMAETMGIPKNAIVSNIILDAMAAAEGNETMPFIALLRDRISSTRPAA